MPGINTAVHECSCIYTKIAAFKYVMMNEKKGDVKIIKDLEGVGVCYLKVFKEDTFKFCQYSIE